MVRDGSGMPQPEHFGPFTHEETAVERRLAVPRLSLLAVCMCLYALSSQLSFVNSPVANRQVDVAAAAAVKYETDMPAENGVYPVGNAKRTVMVTGIVMLFLFYLLLLLLDNQSVLLPPEDEFDEYVDVAAAAAVKYETDMPAENGVYPVGNAKRTAPYGERDPLPEGYGIRTGLSDLLKPLNAEAGVVAKEDSIPTVLATRFAITIPCV
ncbi:unnamed protein product [Symbiodinium sp. CCMP2456]|nr:unnamed protein product [Symbiodinium sp. CCMP2456]